jgi:hypothetical protein
MPAWFGGSIPGGGLGIFLFFTASRTAPRPTHPPIQWAPGTLSSVIKRPGREADHSPPSSAEIKHAWRYTSSPEYVFMACCLVKHRDNLALLFTLRPRDSLPRVSVVGLGMVRWLFNDATTSAVISVTCHERMIKSRNLKELVRKRSWPISGYFPGIFLVELNKSTKNM